MDCQQSTCLICRSVISSSTVGRVNNLDALFLLQIVFEIPSGSYLLNTLKDESLKIIKMCDPCYNLSRECTEIYEQIGKIVKRFWEIKSKIVGNASSSKNSKGEMAEADGWTAQFRTFVKHHEFNGSRFPFVVQDMETLVSCSPLPTQQLTNDSTVKPEEVTGELVQNIELALDEPLERPSSSGVEESSLVTTPDELPEEKETGSGQDDHDNEANEVDSDDSSDFEFIATPFNPEEWTFASLKNKEHSNFKDDSSEDKVPVRANPHKKPKLKYGLTPNPKTLRYHCLEPTCDKSSVSSTYIIKHYEAEHLKIRKRKMFNCEWPGCGKTSVCKTYIRKHYEVEHAKTKEKESFPCEWTGCGKILSDKAHFEGHMDQHRGTPKWKCGKCGEEFYWRKYWFNHEKNKKCGKSGGKRGTSKGKRENESFDCSWPGCGKRFVDKGVWKCHMSRHKGTP